MDQFILSVDKIVRTLFADAQSSRPHPDAHIIDTSLTEAEKKHAAGLMRVNHCGEVCAQALYQGQAITARNTVTKTTLNKAALEEEEHLAWTAQRVKALGSHTSMLNPIWYMGSLTLGLFAGLVGDKWSLGFLEETEKQVGEHLQGHLASLPLQDAKSRAIIEQMYEDEVQHAQTAQALGAKVLPYPVKFLMRCFSKTMTTISYYI